jgi:hypothetical protein
MKKALIALWILASSTVVYAACSTHTYSQNVMEIIATQTAIEV